MLFYLNLKKTKIISFLSEMKSRLQILQYLLLFIFNLLIENIKLKYIMEYYFYNILLLQIYYGIYYNIILKKTKSFEIKIALLLVWSFGYERYWISRLSQLNTHLL